MNIELEEIRCIAAGQCVDAAPEYFDQRDEDGIAVVLHAEVSEADRADVEAAAARCPAAAIRLHALQG